MGKTLSSLRYFNTFNDPYVTLILGCGTVVVDPMKQQDLSTTCPSESPKLMAQMLQGVFGNYMRKIMVF